MPVAHHPPTNNVRNPVLMPNDTPTLGRDQASPCGVSRVLQGASSPDHPARPWPSCPPWRSPLTPALAARRITRVLRSAFLAKRSDPPRLRRTRRILAVPLRPPLAGTVRHSPTFCDPSNHPPALWVMAIGRTDSCHLRGGHEGGLRRRRLPAASSAAWWLVASGAWKRPRRTTFWLRAQRAGEMVTSTKSGPRHRAATRFPHGGSRFASRVTSAEAPPLAGRSSPHPGASVCRWPPA